MSILEKDGVVKSKIKNKKSLILYYDVLKSIRTGRTIYEILYKHRIINKTLFNNLWFEA